MPLAIAIAGMALTARFLGWRFAVVFFRGVRFLVVAFVTI